MTLSNLRLSRLQTLRRVSAPAGRSADLHSKACGFAGSGRACGNMRELAGRTRNGSAECRSTTSHFPSMCIRAFEAEKPRTYRRGPRYLLTGSPSGDLIKYNEGHFKSWR